MKGNAYIAALFRGGCIAVLFILTASLISVLVQGDHFMYDIVCTVFSVLSYHSFSFAFAYGNRLHIEEFITREDKTIHVSRELRLMLTTPSALLELLGTLSFVLAATLLGACSSIGTMFPVPIQGTWFPAVTLTPLCAAISLHARYEAARHFERLERENGLDKLLSRKWLPLRVLLLLLLYPITAPMAPLLAFVVLSIASIFAKVTALLTILGAIAAAALLILLVWGCKVLCGCYKRKRFIKRMQRSAQAHGYTVHRLVDPYRSFATSRNACTFTLMGEEEEIDCVVISTLNRRTPLIFTSPTDAQFLHRIGTKNHGVSLRHTFEFYHKGEGARVIIVDPSPKEVFVAEDGREKRVYCADVIWKMPVHDADSFIGCLERHCLITKDHFRRE